VEAETLAVERDKRGDAAGAPRSPQDVRDLAGRLESFLQSTLDPSGTVAQGAIEVGDLVMMFRVEPRSSKAPETPQAPGKSGAEEKPARTGRRRRKAPASK
jgi:hypothetical protein